MKSERKRMITNHTAHQRNQ